MFEVVFAALGAMAALPVLFFFCAKLGRYGYLAGEHRFDVHRAKGRV